MVGGSYKYIPDIVFVCAFKTNEGKIKETFSMTILNVI